MTLREINQRIQMTEPCVELVRGQGYHYYQFDNSANEIMGPGTFIVGQTLVYDTTSVMVPYLNHQTDARWIEDGIAYGREIRAREGFPAQGEA